MKRRRFLQLTVSAATAAMVQHASALNSQPAAADVLSLAVGEPPLAAFDTLHASRRSAVEPNQMIEMLLEKRSDSIYQWTIDGRSHPAEALFLQQGRRYRLRMMNATDRAHPVHLPQHNFALTRVNQVPVSGIIKDTVRLEPYNVIEADVLSPL